MNLTKRFETYEDMTQFMNHISMLDLIDVDYDQKTVTVRVLNA